MIRKTLFSSALLALLPLALPLFAQDSEMEMETVTGIEIGKPGGRFVAAGLGDPKSFNPLTANETSSTDILDHLYEPLVGYDPEKKVVRPALASSWEHSEDYLTWTFHLRKGAKWSDGQPFTADDVLFSFQVVYDENIITPAKSFLQVKGQNFEIRKIDDHTVQIVLPALYGPFLRAIGVATMIPKHKLEQPFLDGKFEETLNVDTPASEVVGTGAFRVKSYRSGESVVLEKNPYYWKQDENGTRLPYLDELIFLNVPDLDALDLAFEAGKIDGHQRIPGAKFRRFKEKEQDGNFTVYDLGVDLGDNHLWFNQNTGKNPNTDKPYVDPVKLAWYTNLDFRKAVSHCIDRDGIIRTVYRGRAEAVYGPVSSGDTTWYNPDIPKFEFNLDKAKELLDKIDYIDRDGDGVREDPQGNPIRFTFITNRENDIRERIATIIQESFKAIGLDGVMRLVDFNTLVTAIADSFDYDACLLGLTGSDYPLLGLNVFRSSGRTHHWFPNQEKPATEWEAQVDELIEQILGTPEEADQKKLFDRIQFLYAENQPMSWTVNPKVYVGVRNRFGNMRPIIMRPHFLWNVEEVFVK